MLEQINTSIDTISGAKTKFVETFVKNEEIKNQLQTFIDAQQSFAKTVAKTTVDFFTTLGTSAMAFDTARAFNKSKKGV
jgi:hypothetical protein